MRKLIGIAMGTPRGAPKTDGRQWPTAYLELSRQHPKLAEAALETSRESAWSLSAICESVLRLRAEFEEAGVQRERKALEEDIEAATVMGLSLTEFWKYSTTESESEAEIDAQAARFAGMSLAEYRKWSREAENAESR